MAGSPEGPEVANGREESEEERERCCDHEKCPAYRYCWDDSNNKFPPIRSFFLIWTFLFYVLDVGLDCYVAYEHYRAREDGTDRYAGYYFHATLFFIIAPMIIVNFLSWSLYTWGWVMYQSRTVRGYFNQKTEELVYVELGKNDEGKRRMSRAFPVCNVEDVHVISWPFFRKLNGHRRRRKRRNSEEGAKGGTIALKELPASTLVSEPSVESGKWEETQIPFADSTASPTDQDTITGDCMERQGSTGFDQPDVGNSRFVQSSRAVDETDRLEFYALDLLDTCEYICVTILHVLMLGYAFRIFRLFYKRKQDRYSFDRYRDASFLRLIEAFLESAPQVVLQLYVVLVREEARLLYKVITPISIAVSMVSLALAVADYFSAGKDLYVYDPPPNRARRTERLSWTAYFLIILWHLFMIVSRGIAFALFASIYGRYLFVMVGLHYGIMVYWMYSQHSAVFVRRYADYFDPRRHICGNYCIEMVVAAFNTFFHFKLKGGRSIETLVPFYTLAFVENTLMVLLWFFGRDFTEEIWYEYPSLLAVFGSFILGLVFLLGYYWYIHTHPCQQAVWLPDPNLNHPTLTCSLNRMYRLKEIRGNFFERLVCGQPPHRKGSLASTLGLLPLRRNS